MSDNLQLILRAVQEFDISVSRATELIEIDQEGKFNYDLLPYGAGTQAIFGFDEVPVQKYKELLAERDALAADLANQRARALSECDRCPHDINNQKLLEERDALAAKLAELEGQEPVAWMTANREMTSFVNFHDDDLPLYARPVPAEPVNARLLDVSTGKLEHINAGLCPDSINGPDSRDPACPACRAIAKADADSKLENILHKFGEADFPPGYCLDPNGKMSVPFGREEDFNFGYEIGFREAWEITNSAIRAAGRIPDKQQALILEGMHGAAEPDPEAARLTDEEIASLLAASDKNSPRVPSFFMAEPHKFARAIETAVLRKNGIEVAE